MKQINPWAKAWANAERSANNAERARASWRKKLIDGHEYLEGKHKFERTFSDVGTGEFKVLRGRDAKKANENLFKHYLAAMDKNVKTRSLERWRLVEKFVEDAE